MHSRRLKTFTTNFDPTEDRIRLDCALAVGSQAQIFLTNRLSKIFITELSKQVERLSDVKNSNELLQDFVRNSRLNREPVSISVKETEKWLTNSIDFVKFDKKIRIIFRDNQTHAVHLEADEVILRNMLDIFLKTFIQAGWETNVFPAWVDVSKAETVSSGVIH